MLVKSSKQEIRKHCGMPDLLQMVNFFFDFFVVDWRPHMVMVIYHTWFFGDFLGFVEGLILPEPGRSAWGHHQFPNGQGRVVIFAKVIMCCCEMI